jgi:hypothetical protein
MSKRDQAYTLLRQGHSPGEIAGIMRLRTSEVMQHLWSKIGEGQLRRSDIAFSLKRKVRRAIEEAVARTKSQSPSVICRELAKQGVPCSKFDVRIYLDYRRAPVVLGDMYEIVRSIEVRLHRFVKRVFVAEFGEEEWWRAGVPDMIRAECAALREKDPEPADEPYCYTHLIALREILDRKWGVLCKHLPPEIAQNKKETLERLRQLNRIRNNVMHPVRGGQLSEEEFEFVYNLEDDLGPLSGPETTSAQKPAAPQPQNAESAQSEDTTQSEAPAAPELVSQLTPVEEAPPPQQIAAINEQAAEEEFIPSIKAS